jgi:sulfate/thiosulfate transport system substrate-binding protein
MKNVFGLSFIAIVLIGGAVWLFARSNGDANGGVELLNVSYDPTRELWRDLNAQFIEHYEKETGTRLDIRQSHGGSTSQVRAVIDGLDADVVTLALWSDTDVLRKHGLIAQGWEERLPNRSRPYLSTIVFVVRKGNPKGIKDWPDLVQSGVQIITPNAKTSGNGKMSFLAAWGSVRNRGGTEQEALQYVTQVYRQVPVLDLGARGSTTTFAQKNIGDVHLTWENEASLEVQEANGALEVVYPPASIRAEPYVAFVDANVERKGTRAAAEAYLRFLYAPDAQEVFARHHYRPIDPEVLKRHSQSFPELKLFPISTIAKGWDEAHQRFFASGGVFDQILSSKRSN